MRIQYLAVIFVIIVLPISLVISLYTGNLIKVSNTEAAYNRLLFNATHDAVRTYQMNTLDNTYASEDTSKFRDVNASVNSFYNNLSTGLSRSGYSKEELYEYVPAILFNLYDGFYIYSPYQNVAVENGDNADVYSGASEGSGDTAYSKILLKRAAEKGTITDTTPPTINESVGTTQGGKFVDGSYLDYYNESPILTNEPEFGLQNYNYYACEYKGKTKSGGNYDIVINYTLDNYMRVYGVVDGVFYKYEGYYIYTGGLTAGVTGDWNVRGVDEEGNDLGAVQIRPERLGEYVAYYDPYTVYYHRNGGTTNGQTQRVIYQRKGHEGIKYFNYIIYNGVKYYLDTDHLDNRTETGALDMAVVDAEGRDINKGTATADGYNLDKFQYINYYTQTGDTETEREITKQYNVSFNDTYQGIPIFKLDGKQRIYMSRQELIDIINYMDGYYGGMIVPPNAGGEIATINNFFNNANISNYWRDLNDVYYYTNASDFTTKVNDHIFKNIILDLDPGTTEDPNDDYSVVSDAYNMKYTAYFEFDETEGKSDNENERYYLHQKYNYGDNSKFVFHSWGLGDAVTGTADGARLDVVNPDLDTSLFNQHRIDVITSCIEYSFANAVENFNDYMESAYKYKIPDVSDSDWGKIANNISCLTMMQGMPIGNYKFYNNYSLVIDNKVNEFTPKSGIYVEDNYQAELGGGNTVEFTSPNLQNLKNSGGANSLYTSGKYLTNREVVFHNPGCSEYHTTVGTTREVVGYRVIDYDIDSYVPAADLKGYLLYISSGIQHPAEGEQYDDEWIPFYGSADEPNELGRQVFFYLRPGTGCYNCVISQNKLDFSIDDILGFRNTITLGTGEETLTLSNNVRQAYMRALARERGAKARYSQDISGNRNFGNG